MKLWPAPPSLKNNVHERSDDLEKERRVTEGGLVSRRVVSEPLEDESRCLRLSQRSHCDPSTPPFSSSFLRKLFMIWLST